MPTGKEVLELIISRQSDRKYSDKPIEKREAGKDNRSRKNGSLRV